MTHHLDVDGAGDVDEAHQEQAEALNALIRDTRSFMSARPSPDLRAAIVREIEQRALTPKPARRLAGLWARLWTGTPITLTLRPAYALMAVAGVAVVFALAPRFQSALPGPPAEQGPDDQLVVQFRLESPTATTVRLAGSFSSWQPTHVLHQTATGLWSVTLAVPVGVHEYAFLVDGREWVADPYAAHVRDGFGGISSRIVVLPHGSQKS